MCSSGGGGREGPKSSSSSSSLFSGLSGFGGEFGRSKRDAGGNEGPRIRRRLLLLSVDDMEELRLICGWVGMAA